MAAPFPRTLRSLQEDGTRRRTLRLLVLLALLGAWGVWLVRARVGLIELSVEGRIEVAADVVPVASGVAGRIVATRLAIGERVVAGEALVELDAESEELALTEARTRLAGARARAAAVRLEIGAGERALEAQREAEGAATEEAHARVIEQAARVQTLARRAAKLAELSAGGIATGESATGARDEEAAGRAALAALEATERRLALEGTTRARDREARLAELERELVDLEAAIAVEEAGLARLEREVRLRTIRAPVSGTVGALGTDGPRDGRAPRLGAVVEAGDVLAAIVPELAPRAVGYFPASCAGRIRPGQPTRIRLDGYPWTRFGALAATVESVATEPLGGRLRVECRLAESPATAIPIQHGLPGSLAVEIARVSPAELLLRAAGRRLQPARPDPGGPPGEEAERVASP